MDKFIKKINKTQYTADGIDVVLVLLLVLLLLTLVLLLELLLLLIPDDIARGFFLLSEPLMVILGETFGEPS